jgi:hypothetical protein
MIRKGLRQNVIKVVLLWSCIQRDSKLEKGFPMGGLMVQEKMFRIRIDGQNFFTGRDLASGEVYGSPLLHAGLRASFDAAAAVVARLADVGYDAAVVTDITGRPVNAENDRPSSVADDELDDLWGPDPLTARI